MHARLRVCAARETDLPHFCHAIQTVTLTTQAPARKRTFPCGQCGYSAKSQERLKIYMRRHSVDKLLKCAQCCFATSHPYSLKRHAAKLHEPTQEPSHDARNHASAFQISAEESVRPEEKDSPQSLKRHKRMQQNHVLSAQDSCLRSCPNTLSE